MVGDNKALLIVDVQNDFCEGGSLAVRQSAAVIEAVNSLRSTNDFKRVYLSRDWHPAAHMSFAANHKGAAPFTKLQVTDPAPQVWDLWPVHCVQGSLGAEFAPALIQLPTDTVVSKGMVVGEEAYSAFGTAAHPTALGDSLKAEGIEELWVAGLAYDHCVGESALDSAALGLRTRVLANATRCIAKQPAMTMQKRLCTALCGDECRELCGGGVLQFLDK